MRIFDEVNVLRGSVAWTRPLRLRLARENPPEPAAAPAALPEFDEDGRLYVFRYASASPRHYQIERDRIFDYMKRRRLPDEGQRQIRRDVRNQAELWEI